MWVSEHICRIVTGYVSCATIIQLNVRLTVMLRISEILERGGPILSLSDWRLSSNGLALDNTWLTDLYNNYYDIQIFLVCGIYWGEERGKGGRLINFVIFLTISLYFYYIFLYIFFYTRWTFLSRTFDDILLSIVLLADSRISVHNRIHYM